MSGHIVFFWTRPDESFKKTYMSKSDKLTIKQAFEELSISRTKLYEALKALDIKPQKSGKSSYLKSDELLKVKEFLNVSKRPDVSGQVGHVEKIYQEQISELKKQLEIEQASNKELILKLGQAQGIATALKEENRLLLTTKTEETIEATDAKVVKKGLIAHVLSYWKQ